MYHRPGVVPDGDTKVIEDFRPSELSLPCVGVVPRAANENLYDCRWQSYLYYVAARQGSRRGCTVGSCRGLSNGSFQRIGSVHPLSHGLWPVTAPPTQGSQRPDGSFPLPGIFCFHPLFYQRIDIFTNASEIPRHFVIGDPDNMNRIFCQRLTGTRPISP